MAEFEKCQPRGRRCRLLQQVASLFLFSAFACTFSMKVIMRPIRTQASANIGSKKKPTYCAGRYTQGCIRSPFAHMEHAAIIIMRASVPATFRPPPHPIVIRRRPAGRPAVLVCPSSAEIELADTFRHHAERIHCDDEGAGRR